jgi:ankyrin repeat protein
MPMTITRRSALLSLAAALAAGPACRVRPPASAIAGEPPDVARFLRAVQAGDAPAVAAALARNPAVARACDAAGRSAFVLAHLAGRGEVAKLLRPHLGELDVVEAVLAEDHERFAELVRAHPELCNAAHPIGGTPIYAAALAGQDGMWRQRSAGCAPDAAPPGGSGLTPARAAMDCRTLTGARIAATDLLANGADVNAPQRGGERVLHGAVRRRSAALVRLAVRKGADVHARDAAGRTAEELARELGWEEGAALLAGHAALPRDHRASRFAWDASGAPVRRPDLSDVPRALQCQVTGSSHADLERVRALVAPDPRLVFSISADDELAIEACAHTGARDLIRFHLDHGAPLSLPTAASLGALDAVRRLLDRDPLLVHERGAHDFPVMWYAVLGGGSVATAELLASRGVAVDQESVGTTALHWCAAHDDRELARWLLENGADVNAIGCKWDRAGQTPLALARARGRDALARMLAEHGARA